MTNLSARAYSIRARELGRHLRSAQAQSGHNGKTLARILGWSETRLSRVLSGQASSNAVDVSAFLGACGVVKQARKDILRLCRDDADAHVLRLATADRVDAYVAHAADATEIFEYQSSVIPLVAQVPGYARSALPTWRPESDRIFDQQLTSRLSAASLLDRRDVSLLLHEWALGNPVAATDVMSDQVHHLLRLAVRSNLSVRVIPLGDASEPSAVGGFALMDFPDYAPFVYREDPTGALFLDDADEVDDHRQLRRVLYSAALDEDDSRDLLGRVAADHADAADRTGLLAASL